MDKLSKKKSKKDLDGISFFERFVYLDKSDSIVRPTRLDTNTIKSIKSNLEFILNSRQGCTLSSPALGLNDFNDSSSGSKDLFLRIIEDIEQNITRYEPRISVNSIDFMPSDSHAMQLNFRLACSIISNKGEVSAIDLILDAGTKQFKVS